MSNSVPFSFEVDDETYKAMLWICRENDITIDELVEECIRLMVDPRNRTAVKTLFSDGTEVNSE